MTAHARLHPVSGVVAFTPAPETRSAIALTLDAEDDRKEACRLRNWVRYGYFNEKHPGDVALRESYVRQAAELDERASRLEARAAAVRKGWGK